MMKERLGVSRMTTHTVRRTARTHTVRRTARTHVGLGVIRFDKQVMTGQVYSQDGI